MKKVIILLIVVLVSVNIVLFTYYYLSIKKNNNTFVKKVSEEISRLFVIRRNWKDAEKIIKSNCFPEMLNTEEEMIDYMNSNFYFTSGGILMPIVLEENKNCYVIFLKDQNLNNETGEIIYKNKDRETTFLKIKGLKI